MHSVPATTTMTHALPTAFLYLLIVVPSTLLPCDMCTPLPAFTFYPHHCLPQNSLPFLPPFLLAFSLSGPCGRCSAHPLPAYHCLFHSATCLPTRTDRPATTTFYLHLTLPPTTCPLTGVLNIDGQVQVLVWMTPYLPLWNSYLQPPSFHLSHMDLYHPLRGCLPVPACMPACPLPAFCLASIFLLPFLPAHCHDLVWSHACLPAILPQNMCHASFPFPVCIFFSLPPDPIITLVVQLHFAFLPLFEAADWADMNTAEDLS